MEKHNRTPFSVLTHRQRELPPLMMARGRGVGILAQGVRVAIGENLHHPAIKIINWVVHDRFEAAVVFSMSFFNVVFQSDAEVFILGAYADLFGPDDLDVL